MIAQLCRSNAGGAPEVRQWEDVSEEEFAQRQALRMVNGFFWRREPDTFDHVAREFGVETKS
jgi:hypothetical protein